MHLVPRLICFGDSYYVINSCFPPQPVIKSSHPAEAPSACLREQQTTGNHESQVESVLNQPTITCPVASVQVDSNASRSCSSKRRMGKTMSKSRIIGASMLAMGVLLLCCLPLLAQNNVQPTITSHQASAFAISQPLRDLAKLPPTVQYGFHETEPPRHVDFHPGRGQQSGVDPVEQAFAGLPTVTIIPGLSVEGINNLCGCYPPDTEAAVGDTQVVEWVNLHLQVFDKNTGAVVARPHPRQ